MKKLLAVLLVSLLILTGCSTPETQSTTQVSLNSSIYETYIIDITGTSKHIDKIEIASKMEQFGLDDASEEDLEAFIKNVHEANPLPEGAVAEYRVEGKYLYQDLVLNLNEMVELPEAFISTEYATVEEFQALGVKALVQQFVDTGGEIVE